MAYLTMSEFADKLIAFCKDYPEIDPKKELITDAWVAGRFDREYPEGTVCFECRKAEIKPYLDPGDSHILTIYPKKIGPIN